MAENMAKESPLEAARKLFAPAAAVAEVKAAVPAVEERLAAMEKALASFASTHLEPELHDCGSGIRKWLEKHLHLVVKPGG